MPIKLLVAAAAAVAADGHFRVLQLYPSGKTRTLYTVVIVGYSSEGSEKAEESLNVGMAIARLFTQSLVRYPTDLSTVETSMGRSSFLSFYFLHNLSD